MRTEQNNIDQKLRQLDAQSLPDLSRQDQHWRDMQSLLTGDSAPAPAPRKIGYRWMAAVIIAAVLFTVYKFSVYNQPPASTATTGTAATIDSTAVQNLQLPPLPAYDTAAANSSVTFTNSTTPTGNLSTPVVQPVAKKKIQVSAPALTRVNKSGVNKPDQAIPAVSNQPDISKKSNPTLAGFFEHFRKAPQEVTINPAIDNLVKGKEGTALMIPAGTFNTDSKVVIQLTEYYSYQDIITAKLTTTSNGQPLESGGMLLLRAFSDGKPVNINPGKAIRWFVPDTSAVRMARMSLFNGQTGKGQAALQLVPAGMRQQGDTIAFSHETGDTTIVNWAGSRQDFSNNYLITSVKVLDLKDNPYRTRERKNGLVGFFRISSDAKLSRKALADSLREKYSYYKVKIRNRTDAGLFAVSGRRTTNMSGDYDYFLEDVGDSTWIPSALARRYRLKATDSVTYAVNSQSVVRGMFTKGSFRNIDLSELAGRYSVDVRELGWINCDRFYYTTGPKTNYIVNLGEEASGYYTILVFDKLKSVMAGTPNGNRVFFPNIPKGTPARVLSVGIRDGKIVSGMAVFPATSDYLDTIQFEETSPAAFQTQAAMNDR